MTNRTIFTEALTHETRGVNTLVDNLTLLTARLRCKKIGSWSDVLSTSSDTTTGSTQSSNNVPDRMKWSITLKNVPYQPFYQIDVRYIVIVDK